MAKDGELPEEQVKKVIELAGRELHELEETIGLRRKGMLSPAQAAAISGRARYIMDDMQSAIGSMDAREEAECRAAIQGTTRAVRRCAAAFTAEPTSGVANRTVSDAGQAVCQRRIQGGLLAGKKIHQHIVRRLCRRCMSGTGVGRIIMIFRPELPDGIDRVVNGNRFNRIRARTQVAVSGRRFWWR